MITGIGTDLVEIARVQKAIGRSSFLEKVYTEQERELIAVRSVRAATHFAAKEAVAKAFGCGFAGVAPREIEILRQPSGMPYVVLHGRAKEKAEALGIVRIQLSLTDTKEFAQAYVICESEEAGTEGEASTVGEHCKRLTGKRVSIEEAGLPVLDATGMKEADRLTIEEVGIPSLVLMERAALAVADRVKAYATKDSRIGVLCGTGNNGGDGVAVARLLAEEGYDVTVLIKDATKYVTEEEADGLRSEQERKKSGTPEFLQQMKIATACGVPVCEPWETKSFTIIVDALFGIGLSKPIEGMYADLLEQMNREPHIVIAVDIASGISASDGAVCGVALHATETVTFGAAKWGHLLYPGKDYTGKLTVADIGFPEEALRAQMQGVRLTSAAIKAILPERPAYSNKGTFGKVAVIAGSKNMAGAAYFAACAAYRLGAGLVKAVTPECNREILQTLLPEAMLTTYTDKQDLPAAVKEAVSFADAIIIGPGLGQSEEAEGLVSLLRDTLYKRKDVPVTVWDADALNILAKKMQEEGLGSEEKRLAFLDGYLPENAILTPHPGELSRLLNVPVKELISSLLATAKRISSESNLTYVLKDAVTLTIKNTECIVNTTGNNGMATGGSGDVLCGVIAALCAAGKDPFTAAAVGVWLHGAAGDTAQKSVGAAPMIARDLLRAIGELFEEKEKEEVKHDGV
ncbi:MAG: NAD(P)H-hydrate dehydratase [Lachnospiraceae bacterium]|nr:NAD(P)H-hydrate dehydratase [Lachnospiraceae bacterium]